MVHISFLSMRIISSRHLIEFGVSHPDAGIPLQTWRKTIEARNYSHFADLKTTFNTVDRVSNYFVFDIGGNKFRLITAIHFKMK